MVKRPEVIGALEEALQVKKAKCDRLDSEKTADLIFDFFVETVKRAAQPLLAKRPEDEEEWVIRSRAEVTKLLKQRREERVEAHKEGA